MHFVLTIQVLLVFGGANCPLKFLRYGTQTLTSPYATLYATIKMSIIFTYTFYVHLRKFRLRGVSVLTRTLFLSSQLSGSQVQDVILLLLLHL